jgi:hypothetical protein
MPAYIHGVYTISTASCLRRFPQVVKRVCLAYSAVQPCYQSLARDISFSHVLPGSVSPFEPCPLPSTTSIMAASMQFVNFTSDSSNAAQKAQQGLVRSHVATQRERLKRLRSSKKAPQLPYQQATLQMTWLPENDSAASLANDSKQERRSNAPSVGVPSCTTSPSSLQSDGTLEHSSATSGLSVVEDNNALVPVRESGDISPPFDISSFDQYLGQGSRDWFVQMPRMTSPRMAKHLYYCTILPFYNRAPI